MLKTALIAILGGTLAALINVPLPWTLGPIASIALWSYFRKDELKWSIQIRDIAQILLGYSMGRPFTVEAGQAIMSQLPLMLLATLSTVAAGLLVGFYTQRRTGLSLATCLMGSTPGGLSQMVILSEEIKDADQTAVTIMQTVRMLSVVFTVPFLAIHVLNNSSPMTANTANTMVNAPEWWVLTGVAIAGAIIGKKLHLPTASLLGPLLSTAAFMLITGSHAPSAPLELINISQICVGAYIGSNIDLRKMKEYKGLGGCLSGGILIVLLVSFAGSGVIAMLTGCTLVTAFLGTAPGGLTEMGITALAVGADVSTMTCYQLVRLLFIMLIMPYILKLMVKHLTVCHDKSGS